MFDRNTFKSILYWLLLNTEYFGKKSIQNTVFEYFVKKYQDKSIQ